MSLESAIVALLTADVTISAAVSARIYPDWAPAGAVLPMIVYNRQTTTRVQAAEGSIGMVLATIEISCWAKTYMAVLSLASAIRLCLDKYAGISGGVTISCVRLDGESDTPLVEPGNEQMNEYGINLDFSVWYRE